VQLLLQLTQACPHHFEGGDHLGEGAALYIEQLLFIVKEPLEGEGKSFHD
jgi:hypothetical protein